MFFAIINYSIFLKLGQILMDQVMGIEPIPSPWQGDILPLNYTWMVHPEGVEPSCRA